MTRTSTSATTECDVFVIRKILQIALFVNFCACPFPRVKYKGDVLGHQLFEAYLPSLLHRLYKKRRWRVSKKVQEDKKVKRPDVNGFASASFPNVGIVSFFAQFMGFVLQNQQDQVSTLQKAGWTKYPSFLVWPGLERASTVDVITTGQSTAVFLCVYAIFGMVTTNRVILVQACS